MILLVSLFGSINTNNSRISNIFHYTSNLAINVVTSDFNHGSKRYKECIDNINNHYLHVPAYKRIFLLSVYIVILFSLID